MRAAPLAVVLALTAAAALAQVEVALVQPESGQPLFGPVDIEAEVYPAGAAVRLELEVDGELVGSFEAPPYRLEFDVGQENRPHRIVARAFGADGSAAEYALEFPAVRVDEELDASLRQLYVTVVADGRRVLDLEQDDLEVLDDGSPQQIVTFGRGNVALAAVVLIDASASMRGRHLRFALGAATEFAGGVRQQDEVSVQLFSDRLKFASPFAGERTALARGLAEVEAEGGTALHDHLYRALKLLESRQGRRVVVLLSDGNDSHSVLRMVDVSWLARRTRSMVYWIRVERGREVEHRFSAWKGPEQYQRERELLEALVSESGGRTVTLSTIDAAAEAVREVLAELREQYVIGYYPSNRRGDGAWHRVQVRVRRPGAQPRALHGYVDY